MIRGGGKQRMSALVGKAGEHATACQLLLRGLDVAFMQVGTGMDLMAENGCRIQVKCGHLRTSPSMMELYHRPVYSMHFAESRRVPTAASVNKLIPRKRFVDCCDVVVYWGIEENRFWIIPPQLCDERQCVILGPTNERQFEGDLKEMQEMVALGFSQKEIGQYYGIRQSSVGRRLQRVGTSAHEQSTVIKIRACENQWERILEHHVDVVQRVGESPQFIFNDGTNGVEGA